MILNNNTVTTCVYDTMVFSKVVVSGFVYNHFIYQSIRVFIYITWTKTRLIVIKLQLIYNHIKHFIDFKVA